MTNNIARVFVNDVEVGSLPAETYKTIVTHVKKQKSLYFAQAGNALWVIFRALYSIVRLTPFTIALFFMVGAIFVPDALTAVFAELQKAPAAAITEALRKAFGTVLSLNTIVYSIALSSSRVAPGFVNYFDDEINRHIRSMLEVPAEGPVSVRIGSTENNYRNE